MTTRLRCGGYQGEASVLTRALRVLDGALAGSGLTVEITPSVTALDHKAADLLGLVERGDLELCYFNASYLAAERVPALQALDLPFVVTDRARAFRLLDGTLGTLLTAAVEHAVTGYRVLGYWDNGFRHFTNGVRPIRRVADCAGLRLRTVGSPLHHEIFGALGFTPVPVDVKDLPQAVASGAVDAQENPLTNTVNFDLHQHHKHISLTAHFFGVALLLVNRPWFEALPAPIAARLREAANRATTAQRGFAAAEDDLCLARLRADGCAIVGLDEIDRAGFSAAVAPVRERVLRALDPAIAAALAS